MSTCMAKQSLVRRLSISLTFENERDSRSWTRLAKNILIDMRLI
jgi:hypothetical protein